MEETVIEKSVQKAGSRLDEQLGSLGKHFTACLITRMNNYQDAITESLKYLTKEQGQTGIYISTTKSYKPLVDYFATRDIDPSKLLIIDLIPNPAEVDGPTNCLKMPMPASLTELSMAILESSALSKANFVFFDSVEIFFVYNEPQAVEMFFSFMLNKLRETRVVGLGVSLSSIYPDEGLDRVYKLFDNRIEV